MNILIINGSPKSERSDTLQVTRAFLEGMGETASDIIDTMTADIRPCLGCFTCWDKTPGHCIQRDAMPALLEKYTAADLVIWSTPLYCYGLPSNAKAFMDRLLPLNRASMYTDENGHTHHHANANRFPKTLLICGCGFPETTYNCEALRFQFRRTSAEKATMFFCVEAPLLGLPGTDPVTRPYLERVRRAGHEYAETGTLSPETLRDLETPMYPPDLYRQGGK